MKKKLLFASSALLAFGVAWMWFAPRIRLDIAAKNYDPEKLELWRIDPMHKSRKILPNGIEAGLLHLGDGSDVKYWFINRHVQPGMGTTRCDSPGGKTEYLHGCFCCEVSLPEFKNWSELKSHIAKWDGSAP